MLPLPASVEPYIGNAKELSFFYPWVIALVAPLIVILIIVIKHDFVKFMRVDPKKIKQRRNYRITLFFSRLLIFSLVIVALATPYLEKRTISEGVARVTLLVDNSTSMQLYDPDVESLKNRLQQRISVDTRVIAGGEQSNIGDAILANINQDGAILLISDGNSNAGVGLDEVALFARNINSTISAIRLDPVKRDVGVFIAGPDKTTSNVENLFKIFVNRVNVSDYYIKITVDNVTVFEDRSSLDYHEISHSFSEGTHQIVAQVGYEADHFPQNNIYYKSVRVIEAPKVLFVNQKQDPLEGVLTELYDVDTNIRVPEDLSKYYAVVVNDLPVGFVDHIENLTRYTIEGNGLFVVGGPHSFDLGDPSYKNTPFESLLPVKVGDSERRGTVSVVILIDISGSAWFYTVSEGSDTKIIELEKALANNIINDLGFDSNIGAIAFRDQAYLISELYPAGSVRKSLTERIASIKYLEYGEQSVWGKGTQLIPAMDGAINLLWGLGGAKYVVLITDGDRTGIVEDEQTLFERIEILEAIGIKIVTVGVGPRTDAEFMQEIADKGNGYYVQAAQANRLKFIFGQPETRDDDSSFGLNIIDMNHFITRDLELHAEMTGYNKVVAKSNAKMLITSDAGDTALAVSRYGLGRVATFNVFTEKDLGPLLQTRNSKLISRIMNWVIGDPERKKDFWVYVPDTRKDTRSFVRVRSSKPVTSGEFEFVKVADNIYEAEFYAGSQGFHSVLSTQYAVNHPLEYSEVGQGNELEKLVFRTGGKIFKEGDTNGISEFVTQSSRRVKSDRQYFRWPFLLMALLVYTIEVCIRRISENIRNSEE